MVRIPQFLGRAALFAAVAAGGTSLLNAGGAHALACAPSSAGTFTMSAVTFLAGTLGSTCEVANFPPANPNLASVDVNFGPPTVTGPVAGSYWYSLTSISPYPEFHSVSMNMDIGGLQQATATKNIYSAAPISGVFDPATLIGSVTSTGGATAFVDLSNKTLSTIYVSDSYSISDSTSLNSISNNFRATPGPLPVLGAGAAFGFSRKLRGRIKACRTA